MLMLAYSSLNSGLFFFLEHNFVLSENHFDALYRLFSYVELANIHLNCFE